MVAEGAHYPVSGEKEGTGVEKRYELMLDDERSYVNVWQYRSVGRRPWGSILYPDKNGDIGMYIKKGELPVPPRISIVVSSAA